METIMETINIGKTLYELAKAATNNKDNKGGNSFILAVDNAETEGTAAVLSSGSIQEILTLTASVVTSAVNVLNRNFPEMPKKEKIDLIAKLCAHAVASGLTKEGLTKEGEE